MNAKIQNIILVGVSFIFIVGCGDSKLEGPKPPPAKSKKASTDGPENGYGVEKLLHNEGVFYEVLGLWFFVDILRDENFKVEVSYQEIEVSQEEDKKWVGQQSALVLKLNRTLKSERMAQDYTFFQNKELSSNDYIVWDLAWIGKGEFCYRRKIELDQGVFMFDEFFNSPHPSMDPDSDYAEKEPRKEYCEPNGMDNEPYRSKFIRMRIVEKVRN